MQKRSSKLGGDVNHAALDIVRLATEGRDGEPDHGPATPEPSKNPAAVELGRRGGLKGGKARAESLTPEQRAEIARAAAEARWKKKP